MDFVGFRNYMYLLSDGHYRQALFNTVILTFVTLACNMALGLLVANMLNISVKGIGVYRVGFFIPWVSSLVAASMIWLWIYEPAHGILNEVLSLVGISRQTWIYDPKLARLCIITMTVWRWVGYNMIIYLAGLQGIPTELYEAATIDGAGSVLRFFRITIPMLRPVTFFLFVTGMIQNFNMFEQIQIMTMGGPVNATTTVVHQIYNRAFENMLFGYAAAQSVVLLLIVAAITLFNFRYGQKGLDTSL